MARQHLVRRLVLLMAVLAFTLVEGTPASGVSAHPLPVAPRHSTAPTVNAQSLASQPAAITTNGTCSPNDGSGIALTQPLSLTNGGTAYKATFINLSSCTQDVGLASYQIQGILLGDQFSFDAMTATLQPALTLGSTASLTVTVPDCRFQVDAFYGPVLDAEGIFPDYGTRLLGVRLGNNGCGTPTPAGSATVTLTGTPIDTPTGTPPTDTPTSTAESGTPAATATDTVGTSETATDTPTPTGTLEIAEADTPTATATTGRGGAGTNTPTDTDTPTATPTDSLTPVATAGIIGAASATATGTPTATSTDTPTSTATATSSSSATATATPTATETGTLSAPGVRTGSRVVQPPSATPTQTPPATPIPCATNTRAFHPGACAKTPTKAPQAHISLSVRSATVGIRIRMTGSGFANHERITLALNSEALQTTPSVIFTAGTAGTAPRVVKAAADGTFTASFVVPSWILGGANTVTAIGADSQALADAVLTGRNLPAASRYYFAGGLQTASTHSTIGVVNTGRSRALAQLTFYFGRGRMLQRQVTIPGRTQLTVPVASWLGPVGAFGLVMTVDRRAAAQLDLSRLSGNGGTIIGRARPDTTWYLAGGSTRSPFQETIALLNPSRTATARVRLRLVLNAVGKARTLLVRVPPHTHLTVNLNRLKLATAFGIVVTANHAIVVERTQTFGRGGSGITAQGGTHAAATTWLFAEGDTTRGRQTYFSVLNPGRRAARVTATFRDAAGRVLVRRSIAVPADRLAVIAVQGFLRGRRFAAVVTGTQPIVVERTEYTGDLRGAHAVGSAVFGLNGPAAQWTFPLGEIGHAGSESLLLYNPFRVRITVDVAVYQLSGFVATRRITVAPRAQYEVKVDKVFRRLSRFHGMVMHGTHAFVATQVTFSSDHIALRATEGLAQ